MSIYRYYCDGGARPTNPGPGGFGWLNMNEKDKVVCYYHKDCEEETTNNREELKAIIGVMDSLLTILNSITDNNLKKEYCEDDEHIIYADSAYVVNILTSWSKNWERNGWTRAGGKTIENLDLVKQACTLYYNCITNFKNFQIKHIRGHQGTVGNELADALSWSYERFEELAEKKGVAF